VVEEAPTTVLAADLATSVMEYKLKAEAGEGEGTLNPAGPAVADCGSGCRRSIFVAGDEVDGGSETQRSALGQGGRVAGDRECMTVV
jgi:hypothetical protein